jgi:hypothetical protein
MASEDWFRYLCESLAIGANERSLNDALRDRLVDQLDAVLGACRSENRDHFYAGSYGRSTTIRGTQYTTFFYQLPGAMFDQYDALLGNRQLKLLEYLCSTVQHAGQNIKLNADSESADVQTQEGVRFRLFPYFRRAEDVHLLPNACSGGFWRPCWPKAEMQTFATRDEACNGNLVALARLVRAWREHSNVSMSGMLIDTLAYQFMGCWQYREKSYAHYAHMTLDFLMFLAGRCQTQAHWRAPGSALRVPGGAFHQQARIGAFRAREALDHLQHGHHGSAQRIYRAIFGAAFPQAPALRIA